MSREDLRREWPENTPGHVQRDSSAPGTDEFGPSPVTVMNLTPHTVTVLGGALPVVFEPEGLARVSDDSSPAGEVLGVPLVDVRFGDVVGLPAPDDGVVYLVARVVAVALPDRADLVFPFDEVRDAEGRILGVRALARPANRTDRL